MASASSDTGETREACVHSEALCTRPASRSVNWLDFRQQGHLNSAEGGDPRRLFETVAANCDAAHD